jgi:hypothetical protein
MGAGYSNTSYQTELIIAERTTMTDNRDPLEKAVDRTYHQQMRDAAVLVERERCIDIVQAARFGDVDRDLRSIIHMIESGQTATEIKNHS